MKNENQKAKTTTKENKKIAVLTSGGDAPGMNAAIRAVVFESAKQGFEVFGVKDGYLGLFNNQIEILNPQTFPRVLNVSGTFLGTARFLDFQNNLDVRKQCAQNLKNLGIDKLVVIGGDGSYKGASKLHELGIQCVGLPATIDNDICATDFTIGFSTALNNIVDAIEKLRDTSVSHNRCSIIEVMGRHKGDLALFGGLAAGADVIVTRENLLSQKTICQKIKSLRQANQRHAIVVVTEHIFDVASLAKEVENYSGFETRAQVLGHIQRGGKPTAEDLVLAFRMGSYAVSLLQQNIFNCAVGTCGLNLHYTTFGDLFEKTYEKNELFNVVAKLL
ncbi:ATP-dependent 6-phosphofructokinase ['Catharanthus roseus' aster yellows phytoplasma]|uniref:6-phosphofructokinase n=1 Tax='Catharanthus roseus' aster yellows phytoplasma TaxID=1193712 RepID=A0A4P6MD55_9MOLU|nr:ATP-dependent 6-phosphofructokinase ['Catharanthus roseus' aster yellows phytoplasma]QBF23878.1 6-phosphofructokinase ['Catharanthus roseus' aster yellows phytoplasma]